jgi:hypothetical protein
MDVLSKFVRRSGSDRWHLIVSFRAIQAVNLAWLRLMECQSKWGGAMSDRILNLTQLEALYEEPLRKSLVKVAQHITAEYGAWIGARGFAF